MSNTHRLPGLDGLRAVSVALVVLYHAAPGGNGFIAAVAARGLFGVTVFFAISGFLITWLLLREEESSGRFSLTAFYFRRFFRIIPPAYVYLAALCLFALPGLSWSEVFASALFYRNLSGGSDYTQHYWSLAIEEQFYICWPLFLAAVPGRRRLAFVAALCLFAPLWRQLNIHHFGADAVNWLRADLRYDAILYGALLALVRQRYRESRYYLSTARRGDMVFNASFAALVGTFFLQTLSLPGVISALLIPLQSICVCAIIFSLIDGTAYANRLLNTKVFVLVGHASYSIYLWQQLYFVGASTAWFRTFPANILCVLGSAGLSYWLVEKQALALRVRLSSRHADVSSPLRSAELSAPTYPPN